jgi:thiamine biosynthesis lipoprotein
MVDPTLGHAITAAGYDRDFAQLSSGRGGVIRPLPAAHARTSAPPHQRPHWSDVEIDEARGTLLVPRGCSLDLGAIAKAAGADRAAATIAQTLGIGALVSLGGDVAMRGPSPDGGWPVHVVSTTASDDRRDRGQVVMLSGGGLATSSPGARRWLQDGEPRHHIIDPRTLRPADTDWLSITVAAHDCVAANAAATAGVVLGNLAPLWLEGTGYPCRLVDATGEVRRLGAWPMAETWSS